jgi:hypothetical protein
MHADQIAFGIEFEWDGDALSPREAHLPGRQPREGHFRQHRDAAPRTGHVLEGDQDLW